MKIIHILIFGALWGLFAYPMEQIGSYSSSINTLSTTPEESDSDNGSDDNGILILRNEYNEENNENNTNDYFMQLWSVHISDKEAMRAILLSPEDKPPAANIVTYILIRAIGEGNSEKVKMLLSLDKDFTNGATSACESSVHDKYAAMLHISLELLYHTIYHRPQSILFPVPPSKLADLHQATIISNEDDNNRVTLQERMHICELLFRRCNPDSINFYRCACPNQCEGRMLHDATATNNINAIKWLISHNVDVNSKNSLNETPLHLACKAKHYKAAIYLCQAGANCNARNVDDATPLHYLALNDPRIIPSPFLVQYMLYQGANKKLIDKDKYCAMSRYYIQTSLSIFFPAINALTSLDAREKIGNKIIELLNPHHPQPRPTIPESAREIIIDEAGGNTNIIYQLYNREIGKNIKKC